jgi:hypothetical protein
MCAHEKEPRSPRKTRPPAVVASLLPLDPARRFALTPALSQGERENSLGGLYSSARRIWKGMTFSGKYHVDIPREGSTVDERAQDQRDCRADASVPRDAAGGHRAAALGAGGLLPAATRRAAVAKPQGCHP